jgi:predicted nucleotidyltransferase
MPYCTMRLSGEQAKTIRNCVLRFDPGAEVFLFGSRTDDTRRGGDIDLLIVSRRIGLRERLRLQNALQDALGLQKIDLVIVDDVDHNPFAKSVQTRSIPL